MAARLPLVIANGQIEQLQPSDTLQGIASFTYPQTAGSALVLGSVVCSTGTADQVNLAQANSLSTSQVLGLSTGTVALNATGPIQFAGVLTGLTGLTSGVPVYLSPSTAGGFTTTAPTSAGQVVVRIGQALSTTELFIDVQPPVLL